MCNTKVLQFTLKISLTLYVPLFYQQFRTVIASAFLHAAYLLKAGQARAAVSRLLVKTKQACCYISLGTT